MRRKLIAITMAAVMLLSLLPTVGVSADPEYSADKQVLLSKISEALPLLYEDSTEQTRKYLYDRYQQAQAVYYNEDAADLEISNAISELVNAIDKLSPMIDSTRAYSRHLYL